ncbi:hypothetical protein SUGI_0325060 [Cryptomeria japonica]|nr:hypothetical protein SUGI_0325060 [Cryptomeria japonica]
MFGGSECEISFKQTTTAMAPTFVTTDRHNFKETVQKLTGVSQGEKLPVTIPARISSRGRGVAEMESDAVMKNMIELGPQKSEYRLQKRRKVERNLEIKLGFTVHDPGNAMKLAGNKYALSPTLIPSPISPLGADLFSYSYSPSYSSTPTSCNQSSYLEEEVEEFCFRPLPSLKSEPKLLPLFPLSCSTQPTNT